MGALALIVEFGRIKRILGRLPSAAKASFKPAGREATRNSALRLDVFSGQANRRCAPRERLRFSLSWKPLTKASARAARPCRLPVCSRKQKPKPPPGTDVG